MECTKSIEKEVCVQARVSVIPKAKTGEIELECVGEPRREKCDCEFPECDFIISQMVCIKIPIRFSADAKAVSIGIVCEKKPEDCEPDHFEDCYEYGGIMYKSSSGKSSPARSFARNYLYTEKNNPAPT